MLSILNRPVKAETKGARQRQLRDEEAGGLASPCSHLAAAACYAIRIIRQVRLRKGDRGLPSWIQKGALTKFLKGLLKLLLCVHDDGSIPRHRLLKRLTGNEKKSDTIVARLNHNFVTSLKQHERAIVSLCWRRRI